MYRYKIGTLSVDCGYEESTIIHEKEFSRFEFDSIMSNAYAKVLTDEGMDCCPSDVIYKVKKILWELGFQADKHTQTFVIPDHNFSSDDYDEYDGVNYQIEIIKHKIKQP